MSINNSKEECNLQGDLNKHTHPKYYGQTKNKKKTLQDSFKKVKIANENLTLSMRYVLALLSVSNY